MVLITSSPADYDQFEALIKTYVTISTRSRFVGDSKRLREEKELAWKRGLREGFSEALAEMINGVRCKRFSNLDRVELSTGIETQNLLDFAAAAMLAELSNKPATATDPVASENSKARLGGIVDEFVKACWELAVPSTWLEEETRVRRERVMSGLEEPIAEDADWLESIHAQRVKDLETVEALRAKMPASDEHDYLAPNCLASDRPPSLRQAGTSCDLCPRVSIWSPRVSKSGRQGGIARQDP